VVSATDPYGRILGFLDRPQYGSHRKQIFPALRRRCGPPSEHTWSGENKNLGHRLGRDL
jgi:hypothetical protein